MHVWGDEFDWDGFNEAIKFFCNTYTKLTGKHPICKEKYGTLRLEFEGIWIENDDDIKNCQLALMAATCKYPQFTIELLDDYLFGELPGETLNAIRKPRE